MCALILKRKILGKDSPIVFNYKFIVFIKELTIIHGKLLQ